VKKKKKKREKHLDFRSAFPLLQTLFVVDFWILFCSISVASPIPIPFYRMLQILYINCCWSFPSIVVDPPTLSIQVIDVDFRALLRPLI
jgi:hypothetical protein